MSPSTTSSASSSKLPVSSVPLRRGAWSQAEDNLLRRCKEKYGAISWSRVPNLAGLNRCRKSCRLRWLNYLDPRVKRGTFEEDEDDLIIRLHKLLGNRWSLIAGPLPGRTANDVKNYWNFHLSKKLDVTDNKYGGRQEGVLPIKPQSRSLLRKKNTGCITERHQEDHRVSGFSDDQEAHESWLDKLLLDDEEMVTGHEANFELEEYKQGYLMLDGWIEWDNLFSNMQLWC